MSQKSPFFTLCHHLLLFYIISVAEHLQYLENNIMSEMTSPLLFCEMHNLNGTLEESDLCTFKCSSI